MATSTSETVESATPTATEDETGGENETPATSPTPGDPTATATQAVEELPDTGNAAKATGESSASIFWLAVIIAGVLAFAGLRVNKRSKQTSD